MIPFFMYLHVVEDGRTKIKLPLPLFIAWILLFCLALVLLPFVLITALVFWVLKYDLRILRFFPKCLAIVCALSGLIIFIEEKNKRVYLSIR